MESEENLRFSEYSPQEDDIGSESSSHVKKDVFLNPKEKSFSDDEREDVYEDNSQFESYQNSEDYSEFLGNQSSDPNSSPYLRSLFGISEFENIFEDLSIENTHVIEAGNKISLPPPMVPRTPENPSTVVTLQEIEPRHSDSTTSPQQISANVDSQSTLPDTSQNRVRPGDHIYPRDKYSCSLCNVRYQMKSALIAHQYTHLIAHQYTHSRCMLHRCKHCQREFRDGNSFISHLNTHTEERPYACSQCGKRFESEKFLKEHERKHPVERPHVCEICKRCFAKKDTLDRHLRTHTGRRPYVCSLCPKVFSRKHHLDRHLISHNEPKEFICETCGRKYVRKHYFKEHRKTH